MVTDEVVKLMKKKYSHWYKEYVDYKNEREQILDKIKECEKKLSDLGCFSFFKRKELEIVLGDVWI